MGVRTVAHDRGGSCDHPAGLTACGSKGSPPRHPRISLGRGRALLLMESIHSPRPSPSPRLTHRLTCVHCYPAIQTQMSGGRTLMPSLPRRHTHTHGGDRLGMPA